MARTKEQIQLMVLGALAGCAALVAFILFVFMPMLDELRSARSETAKIHGRVDELRTAVRDRPAIQQEIEDTLEVLRHATGLLPLPVLGNYMLGMENAILSCVKEDGPDILAITSAGDPMEIRGGSGTFKVFQTRCVAASGLHDLARFFYDIQESFPYVSVSGVTITPKDDVPEQHSVSFVISWLIWARPDKLPSFLLE